jgi:FkbM family methyltransferase
MANLVEIESAGTKFKVVDPDVVCPYGGNTFRDEEDVKLEFWSSFTEGDTVVDVGAAWGGYAMPALAQGANVLAFDSTEDSERILKANAKANGWEWRLEFRRYALWDETDYPEWMKKEIFETRYPTGQVPRVVTLDRVFSELGVRREAPRIAAMKIDVEGAELGVLRGSRETLACHKPRLVLVEDHAGIYEHCTDETSSEPCRALLRELGYEVKDRWFGDRPGGRNFIVAKLAW